MRRLGLILLATTSIRILAAQPATLAGPVEGFTFDLPTHSLRAVIGLPGSSFFGPALAAGFDRGWVAPHADYAIAFQQGECRLVRGLGAGVVSTASLQGARGAAEGIAWAADGSVAVLFSRTANWLQVLNGLPEAPQFGPAVDLSSLGGDLAAVAADQRGQNIAFAVEGDNGGVFLLGSTQSFTPLLAVPHARALAFSGEGSRVYVLDGVSLGLTVLTVADGSAEALSLDGLQDPSGIASGRDPQGREVVYIASRKDQILRLYDPAAQQALLDLALDFSPTGIAALGPHSFVLAGRAQASDPLWILAGAPQPAVYFVPAAPSTGGLD